LNQLQYFIQNEVTVYLLNFTNKDNKYLIIFRLIESSYATLVELKL